MSKIRASNALRDKAERAAKDIVALLDQAKTMALKVDLVGATEAIRHARQDAVKLCLQYEAKILELEASLARSQSSASLANRQLQSMSYFTKKAGETETAAPAPVGAADAQHPHP
jgi:predicted kinase